MGFFGDLSWGVLSRDAIPYKYGIEVRDLLWCRGTRRKVSQDGAKSRGEK